MAGHRLSKELVSEQRHTKAIKIPSRAEANLGAGNGRALGSDDPATEEQHLVRAAAGSVQQQTGNHRNQVVSHRSLPR